MKYYTLSAVVNGSNVRLKRNAFATRNDAIDYMFKYYDDHSLYSLQVRDEHIVGDNKHSIEYVCNYHNRFTITREVIA